MKNIQYIWDTLWSKTPDKIAIKLILAIEDTLWTHHKYDEIKNDIKDMIYYEENTH